MIDDETIDLGFPSSLLCYLVLYKRVFILRVSVFTPIPVTQVSISDHDPLKVTILAVCHLDISTHHHRSKVNASSLSSVWTSSSHDQSSHFYGGFYFPVLGSQNLEAINGLYIFCSHSTCQYHTINNWWDGHLSFETGGLKACELQSRQSYLEHSWA